MSHVVEGTTETCCHRVSYWFEGEKRVSLPLKRELEEHAEERAKECIIQGCRSGELNYTDSGTEREYMGWWKIEP
jgi:hypothetical protein